MLWRWNMRGIGVQDVHSVTLTHAGPVRERHFAEMSLRAHTTRDRTAAEPGFFYCPPALGGLARIRWCIVLASLGKLEKPVAGMQ